MALCMVMVSCGGGEPGPVVRRADAEAAVKGAAQRLGRAEAAGPGHGGQRPGAGLEPGPGLLDPDALDVAGRRHPEFARERPGKRALADVDAAGERGRREVGVEMLADV